jgi:hypothetical protein
MLDALSFAPLALLLLLPFALGTVSTGWIEVFRAGSYPQGTFTASDIQSIAGAYDPDIFEAPSTVDHQQKGMAQGWVEDLKAKGESLYARFKQVPETFAQAIKDGRLKNRSIELFRDLDGEGLYLKAVTWLGAKAPQVKGLEDPASALEFDHSGMEERMAVLHFDDEEDGDGPAADGDPNDEDDTEDEEDAEDEENTEDEDDTEEPEGEELAEEDAGEDEPKGEDGAGEETDEQSETGDSDTEEFSHEAESEIERLRRENRELRRQAEQAGQDQRVQEFEQFCEERVPPAVRDEVVSIFRALHTSDTIRFDHDSHESAAEAFEEVVDSLSLTYLFGDVATEPDEGEGARGTDLESAVRQSMAEQGHEV